MFFLNLLVIYLAYLIGNYRGRRTGLTQGYLRARQIFGGRKW